MVKCNLFDGIAEDFLNRLTPIQLLHKFGDSIGLSNLAVVASDCVSTTIFLYQGDAKLQYVKISENKCSKPGDSLKTGSIIRMIKDVKVSEFSGPLPLRERLLGIFQDSVQTFDCNPLQTCSICHGNKKCATCKARGNVTCQDCGGNGECARCDGEGKEACPSCEGSGDCPDCGGTGKVACRVCSGTGLCEACDGSGECINCNGTGACDACNSSGCCPDCDGDGTTQCEWCYGDGEVDCPDCNGTGNYIDNECRKCSGYGTIYKNGHDITCPICEGSGRYVVECRRCDGSGKIECINCNGDGELTCDTCHGSGNCVTCRGTGKCKICHGDGKCRKCRGAKICLRCNGRGNFWCTACLKHNGKCITCEGSGSITCTICNGTSKCPTCEGEGRVICPSCSGSKRCTNCKATGKERCDQCGGNGKYQTFEEFALTPYEVSKVFKVSLEPFTDKELKGNTIYSGVFKQWDRNDVELDKTCSIAYLIKEPKQSKSLLDWLNNEVSRNQRQDYYPLYAYCNVYEFKIITIKYKVGKKEYSIVIGGKEHTVFYDCVPSKIELVLHSIKQRFSR